MKAAFLEKVKKITIKEIPKPACSDDKVLIKIMEVSLCGSDIHYFNYGKIGDFVIKEPIILGHESSGIIAEVGKNVKNLKEGDRVAIEPGVPCYHCDYCLRGLYNLCNNVVFMATPPDNGALVEYLEYDPNFVYKISDNVSFTQAALAEPLSVAYHCLKKGRIKPGDSICIFGAGPIGLSILKLSKVFGATKIFIADLNEFRLGIAKRLGASFPINVVNAEIFKRVMEETNNEGVDLSIEATGSEKQIAESIKITKKGGSVVWVGVAKSVIEIPYLDILCKELKISGIFRYSNTYKPILELLDNKIINTDYFVTHRFKLKDIEEAFRVAADPKIDKMKIIIEIG